MRIAYIWLKLEHNWHAWVDTSKSQIAKGADAHGQWECFETSRYQLNVGCVVLMYSLTRRKCSTPIKEIYPSTKSLSWIAQLAQLAHPLSLKVFAYRTMHYRSVWFRSCTASLWNNVSVVVFLAFPVLFTFKSSIPKDFSLFFSPSLSKVLANHYDAHSWVHSLNDRLIKEKSKHV